MERYFIRLSYKGSAYKGWQRQRSDLTVQGMLEKALSAVLGEDIPVTGGARTDTGVHAVNYVAHFDATGIKKHDDLKYKLNGYLPGDIQIQDIIKVAPSAHARFDAVSRTYHYIITRHKSPFLKDLAHFLPWEADIESMNKACAILKEHTDFTSFSKLHSNNKTNNCRISEAHWYKTHDRLIVFRITSDRFLRGMVRALAGTMLNIGRGKMHFSELENILASKNRSRAGMSVPAKGLYLTDISYNDIVFPEENTNRIPWIPVNKD